MPLCTCLRKQNLSLATFLNPCCGCSACALSLGSCSHFFYIFFDTKNDDSSRQYWNERRKLGNMEGRTEFQLLFFMVLGWKLFPRVSDPSFQVGQPQILSFPGTSSELQEPQWVSEYSVICYASHITVLTRETYLINIANETLNFWECFKETIYFRVSWQFSKFLTFKKKIIIGPAKIFFPLLIPSFSLSPPPSFSSFLFFKEII